MSASRSEMGRILSFSTAERTIWVAIDQYHAPQLVDAKGGNLLSSRYIIGASKDPALYDAVDTFVEQGHGRCSTDDLGQGR